MMTIYTTLLWKVIIISFEHLRPRVHAHPLILSPYRLFFPSHFFWGGQLWKPFIVLFLIFSATICMCASNNSCMCVPYLYAFVISVHAVSLFLCATARGSGGRLEVRWNQLFKPQGSASTTTTPPTQSVCLSSSSLQPRWCQAQGSPGLELTCRHTREHTYTPPRARAIHYIPK